MARFSSFQDYLAKHELAGQTSVLENEDDSEESVDGDDSEDDVVALTSQLCYTLAVKPGFHPAYEFKQSHPISTPKTSSIVCLPSSDVFIPLRLFLFYQTQWIF